MLSPAKAYLHLYKTTTRAVDLISNKILLLLRHYNTREARYNMTVDQTVDSGDSNQQLETKTTRN